MQKYQFFKFLIFFNKCVSEFHVWPEYYWYHTENISRVNIWDCCVIFGNVWKLFFFSDIFRHFWPLFPLQTHSKHQQIWTPSKKYESSYKNLQRRSPNSFHLHCVRSYDDLCVSQNTNLRRRGFYNFHPSMPPKISRKKSAIRELRPTSAAHH